MRVGVVETNMELSRCRKRVGCSSMSLKPEHKESIKYFVDGKDVFLWLPTGFGKSICYEVLPFMFDKKLGRDNSRLRSFLSR